MTILEFHPLSEVFPLMPTEGIEWKELCDSICRNGLRHEILLHSDGRILDGRNRYRACLETHAMIRTETFDGTDEEALDLVIDENKHRRHLTPAQWAMVAASEATLRKEMGRPSTKVGPRADLTQDEAARRYGVSVRSVGRARQIQEKDPKLAAEVKAGKKSLKEASRELGYKEDRIKGRDYKKEYEQRKDTKVLLRLVEDLPVGTVPPERKPAKPVNIDSFFNRITRIIGNIIRGDRYLAAVVAEKDNLHPYVRKSKAEVLRNFAQELIAFADELWPEENGNENVTIVDNAAS